MVKKYKHGDLHPERAGWRFFAYSKGREVWRSPDAWEKMLIRNQKWRDANKDRIRYRNQNATTAQRERHAAQQKAKRAAGELKAFDKAQYWANRDAERARKKAWHEANKERVAAWRKAYYAKTRERQIQQGAVYAANRRKTDPLYKLKHDLRARVLIAFKYLKRKKQKKTEALLGASWAEVMATIESRFQPGMTWENRGDWHIDHRVPCAFAETPEELERLCRVDNLYPEWKSTNLLKNRFADADVRAHALSLGFTKDRIDRYRFNT